MWYNKMIKGKVFRFERKGGGFVVILGIDPGIATVGFGVISGNGIRSSFINCGIISTPAGERTEKRLWDIFQNMTELIEKYKPDSIAIEELFFNSNQKTVVNVCQARGVILACAEKHGIPIFEYTPLQVKVAICGYGRAEKRQVQEMTKLQLKLREIPKPDDAADALALAICHATIGASKLGELKTAMLKASKKTAGK